jgi:hypothetical protein
MKLVWFGIGGVLVAALVGAWFVYFVTGFGAFDLPPTAKQLGANKAAAEKAGIWAVPPEDSGGMSSADFRRMAAVKMSLPDPWVPAGGMSAGEAAKVRAAIAGSKTTALGLASVKSVATDFVTGSYPEFSGVRAAAKVLAYDAELAARMGDVEGALESLAACRQLARLSASRKVKIGILIACNMEALANMSASRCATTLRGQPEALNRLAGVFRSSLWEASASEVVRGEEFYEREYLRTLPIKEWSDMTPFSSMQNEVEKPNLTVPGSMVRDAMLSRHYDVYGRMIRAADQGWEEYGKVCDAEAEHAEKAGTITWRTYRGLGGVMFVDALRLRDGRRLALLGGIARLGDPAAKMADDPFAPGNPLRVAAWKGGFAVYSVGSNRKDDGGDLKGERRDAGYEFGAAK